MVRTHTGTMLQCHALKIVIYNIAYFITEKMCNSKMVKFIKGTNR